MSGLQRCLATRAKEWQSSKNGDMKEVHSLLHPSASRPEGPVASLVFSTADLIMAVSRDSKSTWWTSGRLLLMVVSGWAG